MSRPEPPRKGTKVAVKKELPKPSPYHLCDADQACGHAVYEVIVVVKKVAKRLYFCGHHYRKNALHIFEHGYEVNKL